MKNQLSIDTKRVKHKLMKKIYYKRAQLQSGYTRKGQVHIKHKGSGNTG
jgi:hypothetical protein